MAISLGHAVDACLATTLIVAPWFMGGRGAVGHLVFALLPCLAASLWCAKQYFEEERAFRWSGVEWLLAAGTLLVTLQLIPWPHSLLIQLSPAIRELLPLWMQPGDSPVHLGQWSTLSLAPEATRGGLVIFVAYALFFVVLVQRLRTIADLGKLLAVVAVSTVLMACIGLLQFFGGSDAFLWVYSHPSRSAAVVVCGAFQNENHFAHFLSLGVGPLLWCLYQSRKPAAAALHGGERDAWSGSAAHDRWIPAGIRSPLILLGLILVILAGLLTFSRGGVLIMMLTLGTYIVVMRWKGLIDRQTTILLSLVSLVNVVAMLIFGSEILSTQLGTVVQASSLDDLFASRMDLWRAMGDGIAKFWMTGVGVGSHREVYLVFMEESYKAEFTHGESGYLPLLLETGVLGLALMLFGIVTSFRWCWKSFQADQHREAAGSSPSGISTQVVGIACAVFPGLVASATHSIADFVWYIPACMALTVAQLACVCRLQQFSAGRSESRRERGTAGDAAWCMAVPRGAWLALTAGLLVATAVMAQTNWGAAAAALDWDGYMKQAIVRPHLTLTPLQEQERIAEMERRLTNVVRHDPRHARAHLRLAAVYLKRFEMEQRSAENSMDLAQIRDAALASQFATKADQDAWLNVALGESRELLDKALAHSRLALTLCPLQGLGYVHLAELSFLESPRTELKSVLIDQATRVRPHDGHVLFVRGKEAALLGNLPEALALWKQAFRQDSEIRQLIMDSLTDQVPAQFFVATFEPETIDLGQLFERYRAKGRVEEAKWVAQQFVSSLEKEADTKSVEDAVQCWQQAQVTYLWLGDAARAVACQERAVDLAPLDFECRYTLAQLLVQQQQWDAALGHLEWCLRRQPEREDLRQELAEAKLRLTHSSASSATTIR